MIYKIYLEYLDSLWSLKHLKSESKLEAQRQKDYDNFDSRSVHRRRGCTEKSQWARPAGFEEIVCHTVVKIRSLKSVEIGWHFSSNMRKHSSYSTLRIFAQPWTTFVHSVQGHWERWLQSQCLNGHGCHGSAWQLGKVVSAKVRRCESDSLRKCPNNFLRHLARSCESWSQIENSLRIWLDYVGLCWLIFFLVQSCDVVMPLSYAPIVSELHLLLGFLHLLAQQVKR